MKNLEINIGLNVGTIEPVYQGSTTLDTLQRYFEIGVHDFNIDKGTWETEDGAINERIFKVAINVGNMTAKAINFILSNIALDLDQDAIAFRLNGVGQLAFNPMYTGEQFEFNNDYFKEL